MSKAMEGVSEETTTGVKRLYEMQARAAPPVRMPCGNECLHAICLIPALMKEVHGYILSAIHCCQIFHPCTCKLAGSSRYCRSDRACPALIRPRARDMALDVLHDVHRGIASVAAPKFTLVTWFMPHWGVTALQHAGPFMRLSVFSEKRRARICRRPATCCSRRST